MNRQPATSNLDPEMELFAQELAALFIEQVLTTLQGPKPGSLTMLQEEKNAYEINYK